MKHRILTALLCLVLACMSCIGLWSCNPATTPDSGSDPTSTNDPNEQPTEEPRPLETMTVENLKKAKLVYAKSDFGKGGMVYQEIEKLQAAIKNAYGVELVISNDDVKVGTAMDQYKEFEYEILVGNTTRAASSEVLNNLKLNDHGYVLTHKKLVIKGGCDAAVAKSLGQFITNIVKPKKGGDTLFFSNEWDRERHLFYAAQDATLNGFHISNYAVVYPEKGNQYEKELAQRLVDHLTELAGYHIPCYSDATEAGEYEILLGKTNRSFAITTTSGAAVETAGRQIAIVGSNAYQYGLAQSYFADLVSAAAAAEQTAITLPAVTPVSEQKAFSMMSYNVYGFEVYKQRVNNICRLVTKYLPDIVAFQEPALDMMALLDMSNYYAYYNGIPRHTAAVGPQQTGSMTINGQSVTIGGANSVASILYAKDRYDLIEGGTKWMTDTPDTFSKLDNSSHYRIYTYVVLKDKVTGVEFVVVNHHLDFDPQIQDTTMRYAFKFFKENYNDLPVIMLGDYNATKNEPVIKDIMVEKGGFSSLYDMSPRKGSGAASIDWIFAMDCCVSGLYYNYCTETYSDKGGPYSHKYDGKMPSDHAPVYAEMQFSIKSEHTHDWTEASAGVYWKGEDH